MAVVEVKEYTLPDFDRKEILRYCGVKDADDGFLAVLNDCIKEAQDCILARVCYALLPLSVDGDSCDFTYFITRSKSLANNLRGTKNAVAFVCSVGVGMDRLIVKYGKISPVKALCMQAIGSERAEALAEAFCRDLKGKYQGVRGRFSPGYGDLDLQVQEKLFALLQPEKYIGVGLSQSLLMTPSKSISAFVGVEE